jgi:hypothetical protein
MTNIRVLTTYLMKADLLISAVVSFMWFMLEGLTNYTYMNVTVSLSDLSLTRIIHLMLN